MIITRTRFGLLLIAACLVAILLPTAALAMSQSEEIKLGREAVTELRQQTGFCQEPALTEVGVALKEQVTRKDLPWQFFVLEDTKQLNAFALPGGFVFITRRYYEMLNGDELAFVVGHEMAHVDKKHFEQSMKRARKAQIYDLLAGVIVSATKAGRFWGTAADLGTTAFYTKYSRKLEKEADLGGYTLAQQAGFDANAAVSALSKLGKDKSDPITANVFATHPVLSNREDRLGDLGKTGTAPKPWRTVKKPAQPDWKPYAVAKDELARRPGLALRVVDETNARWENKWRDDLRQILARRIVIAGKYDVRGNRRADSDGPAKLSELRSRERVDQLLVVTVLQMEATSRGAGGNSGYEESGEVKFSARLIDTTTGVESRLGTFSQSLTGKNFLPVSYEHLYRDMILTEATIGAAKQLANRLNAPPPPAKVVGLVTLNL